MYTLYEIYKFNNKNNHIIVILELFYFFNYSNNKFIKNINYHLIAYQYFSFE